MPDGFAQKAATAIGQTSSSASAEGAQYDSQGQA